MCSFISVYVYIHTCVCVYFVCMHIYLPCFGVLISIFCPSRPFDRPLFLIEEAWNFSDTHFLPPPLVLSSSFTTSCSHSLPYHPISVVIISFSGETEYLGQISLNVKVVGVGADLAPTSAPLTPFSHTPARGLELAAR